MAVLTRANSELFRRTPDECFDSLDELSDHCCQQRDNSTDVWERPEQIPSQHPADLHSTVACRTSHG